MPATIPCVDLAVESEGDNSRVTKRFDELWVEREGEPFEFDGQLVYPGYDREIGPGTLIDVEFLSSRSQPPEGLSFYARGAKLAWDEHGLEGQGIRLWADKQPRATLRYVNPRKTAELTVVNVWFDKLVQSTPSPTVLRGWAWSGMRIEETPDSVLLRCSGSYEGPNFTDLTARLTFRTV